MTPEEYAEVERIFTACAKAANDGARRRILDSSAPPGSDLRREVEALLAHASPGATGGMPGLLGPAHVRRPDDVGEADHDGLVGSTVGSYRIVRLLQSGGMGRVYEAEQEHPRRRVAVKVLRYDLVSRGMWRRFEQECEILGRLRHPGIAHIIESGTYRHDRHDRPFYAMELVPDARTIIEYADDRRLGTRERLRLMFEVCEAVHEGHREGIVHRDLKPGNILVDPSGQVKIIDFGVARVTNSDIGVTMDTQTGQLIGTLAYMSPEQCEGRAALLDERTDVYALGVVLYELLSGERPHALEDKPLPEAVRIIREDEATRLGTRSTALGGDIQTLVGKAMEKEASRRYRSALEFADDIRRYLASEPLTARPPSTWYQLRKFTARNRVLVGGVFAVLFVSLIGTVLSTRGMVLASRATTQARLEAYRANIIAADAALRMGDVGPAHRRLQRCEPDLRGWEWGYLDAASHQEITAICAQPRGIQAIALSADGGRIVTSSNDGVVRLWSFPEGRRLVELSGHEGPVRGAVFSPDGSRVLTAGEDGALRLWDAASGEPVRTLHEGPVPLGGCAWDRKSGRLAAIFRDGSICLLRDGSGAAIVARGAPGESAEGAAAVHAAVAFSPDARTLITGLTDGRAKLWDAATGEEIGVIEGHEGPVQGVASGPRGDLIATGSADGTVRIHRGSGRDPLVLDHEGHEVWAVRFDPAGERVATGARDAVVRIWDAKSGALLERLLGHETVVSDILYDDGGELLVTCSSEGKVLVWDAMPRATTRAYVRLDRPCKWAAISPDATLIAVAFTDESAATWHLDDPGSQVPLARDGDRVVRLAFDFAGERIVTTTHDGDVCVWEAGSGRQLFAWREHDGRAGWAAFSRDGSRIVSVSRQNAVVRDAASGAKLRAFARVGAGWSFCAFDHDGGRIVTAGMDAAQVWDASTGRQLLEITPRTDSGRSAMRIGTACFSLDGRRLLTASQNDRIQLWDAASGEELVVVKEDDGQKYSAIFSRDDSRIVTSAFLGPVRVWDAASMTPLVMLRQRGTRGSYATFSADGRAILAVDAAGTVEIWRAGRNRGEASPGAARATASRSPSAR